MVGKNCGCLLAPPRTIYGASISPSMNGSVCSSIGYQVIPMNGSPDLKARFRFLMHGRLNEAACARQGCPSWAHRLSREPEARYRRDDAHAVVVPSKRRTK